MKLQTTIERLKRQNTNLQTSYNVLSEQFDKIKTSNNNSSTINQNVSTTTATTVVRYVSGAVSGANLGMNAEQLEKKFKELTEKYDQINL